MEDEPLLGAPQVDTSIPSVAGNQEPATPGPGATETPTASWLDALPEDLKSNEALKGFKEPAEVAKALLEAQGKIQSPPESADKYEIEVPEGMPKDEAFLTSFKGWAHEQGLSQAQAAGLAKQYNEFVAQQVNSFNAQQKTAREQTVKDLKTEWAGEYDANLKTTQRAVRQFAGEEGMKFLDENGLGNHPVLVRMFHRIGQAIGEDALVRGDKPGMQRATNQSGEGMLSFPSMQKG